MVFAFIFKGLILYKNNNKRLKGSWLQAVEENAYQDSTHYRARVVCHSS